MKKYKVTLTEEYEQDYIVLAKDEGEAELLARMGDGEDGEPRYITTSDYPPTIVPYRLDSHTEPLNRHNLRFNAIWNYCNPGVDKLHLSIHKEYEEASRLIRVIARHMNLLTIDDEVTQIILEPYTTFGVEDLVQVYRNFLRTEHRAVIPSQRVLQIDAIEDERDRDICHIAMLAYISYHADWKYATDRSVTDCTDFVSERMFNREFVKKHLLKVEFIEEDTIFGADNPYSLQTLFYNGELDPNDLDRCLQDYAVLIRGRLRTLSAVFLSGDNDSTRRILGDVAILSSKGHDYGYPVDCFPEGTLVIAYENNGVIDIWERLTDDRSLVSHSFGCLIENEECLLPSLYEVEKWMINHGFYEVEPFRCEECGVKSKDIFSCTNPYCG